MSYDHEELLESINKRWETLTITNDFVFGKVMQNPDVCREVLEAILGVPIEHIEYIGRNEDFEVSPDAKGVRLDAYIRDGQGTVYNVEMQATNTRELPQRSRYYQAMLSFAQLAKGKSYRELKDSYVIFICDFDLFGQGRRVYTFEYRDSGNTELQLGDGTHTIFLSATSPSEPQQGAQVNELLDFVSEGTVTGELSSKLQEAVAHVIEDRDWRLEYMMLEVRDQLNRDQGRKLGFQEGKEEGIAEGREAGIQEGREAGIAEGREAGIQEGREAGIAEGREAGIQEGESRSLELIARLVADGRTDDIAHLAANKGLRERLYAEYGINQ